MNTHGGRYGSGKKYFQIRSNQCTVKCISNNDILLIKYNFGFAGHHQSFQSHPHHAGSQIGSVQPHELTTRLQQVHRMGNQGKLTDSIPIVRYNNIIIIRMRIGYNQKIQLFLA